jgi:hypothetical protein
LTLLVLLLLLPGLLLLLWPSCLHKCYTFLEQLNCQVYKSR